MAYHSYMGHEMKWNRLYGVSALQKVWDLSVPAFPSPINQQLLSLSTWQLKSSWFLTKFTQFDSTLASHPQQELG